MGFTARQVRYLKYLFTAAGICSHAACDHVGVRPDVRSAPIVTYQELVTEIWLPMTQFVSCFELAHQKEIAIPTTRRALTAFATKWKVDCGASFVESWTVEQATDAHSTMLLRLHDVEAEDGKVGGHSATTWRVQLTHSREGVDTEVAYSVEPVSPICFNGLEQPELQEFLTRLVLGAIAQKPTTHSGPACLVPRAVTEPGVGAAARRKIERQRQRAENGLNQ